LLLLPTITDIAAMEYERSKADPPKRQHRWFQFSLWSLLVVMTVTALAQPLVIWAWDATRPRIHCSELLKPIDVPLAGR
jgi:hypothetical protein